MQKLNEVGSHTVRRIIQLVASLDEEYKVGEEHFKVGIRCSAHIICLFAPIPFTERKDRKTTSVNNDYWETTFRRTVDFSESTQCNETSMVAAFCSHTMPFPHI